MANNTNDPQFLGGGPKFNRVGAQPPDAEPSPTAAAAPAFPIRRLITALVVLLLIGLLYWITTVPKGLVHVGGHGGISPDAQPAAPGSEGGPSSP